MKLTDDHSTELCALCGAYGGDCQPIGFEYEVPTPTLHTDELRAFATLRAGVCADCLIVAVERLLSQRQMQRWRSVDEVLVDRRKSIRDARDELGTPFVRLPEDAG